MPRQIKKIKGKKRSFEVILKYCLNEMEGSLITGVTKESLEFFCRGLSLP